MVRQPRSAIETLQEQVKSPKRDVERKDRDVKSANQRAAASESARAKGENEKRKIQAEMESKSSLLEAAIKNNTEMEKEWGSLKLDCAVIKEQRLKVTSELRRLREKHEAVAKRLSESSKKLSAAREPI